MPSSTENNIYRDSRFGFQFKVPFGWVERTEQMQESSDHADEGVRATQNGKSQLLLAIFERPPEVQGESLNSAVIITAESTSEYPGLKTAADYFEPLSDTTTGKGFEVVNQPYAFSVGGKRVVRADFSKKVGEVAAYQSSIVVLEKGYFVAFTFLGTGEDEVNELIERLSFLGAASKHTPAAK